MGSSKLKDIGEGIVGAAAITVIVIMPILRSRYAKWGSTDAEVQRSLPGDDLVPHLKGGYTHAVTILASADKVWPWLVQIGQGRGGFYSYDWLENLAGCDIHSMDTIMPELQYLEIGDSVPMHPKMGSPYKVNSIEAGRALVLLLRDKTQVGSWVFFLEELDEWTTRLVSRSRNDWNRSLTNALVFGIFGPISLVMDRKMLLGIKQRAEAATSN